MMRRLLRTLRAGAGALALIASQSTMAHESRPAYLELNALGNGQYDSLWKTPVNAGQDLKVEVRFPPSCRPLLPPSRQDLPGTRVDRVRLDCGAAGLSGQRIELLGLQVGITDVLVRVTDLDGAVVTGLATPSRPWLDVARRQSLAEVAWVYLREGVLHILLGYDHLLFVFGLLLLVPRLGQLIKTITAFTLAHSCTLALATLGLVHVPGPPVEACIALSILLLAVEIMQLREGHVHLAAGRPWLIAFTFGLLHGFGFAGALAEIGLPTQAIPLALLTFNLGVETGQLLFIGALLALIGLMRLRHWRWRWRWPAWTRAMPAYALGSIATALLIDRILAFA